jgi:hypothetical protein
MKKLFGASMLLVLCVLSFLALRTVDIEAALTTTPEPEKLLRHVVLFKFTEDAAPEQVKSIEEAFAALPGKIDAIHDFEWGTDVGVENLSQGFTHCFLVTFRDEEGRAEYLPHPAHMEFVALLQPHLEKVCVVDYWTQK